MDSDKVTDGSSETVSEMDTTLELARSEQDKTLVSSNPDADLVPGHFMFKQPAVVFEKAVKSYGRGSSKKCILQGIDLVVNQGDIYGLLGASGCGKTTLLSCLVGLKKLDRKNGGQVLVFGGRPGTKGVGVPGKRVGYMPQELALYGEFNLPETMNYFGQIYGVSLAEVKRRSEFLLNLLDLPKKSSRQIRTFSGGQQRRISFAATMIHQPELLILDEPTVGVDPMLRQSIWNYLVKLTSSTELDTKPTTIIITTHYIEEARQATRVGLMRNGRLLAEEKPDMLLLRHGLPTLEEVFLKLCMQDHKKAAEKDQAADEKDPAATVASKMDSVSNKSGVESAYSSMIQQELSLMDVSMKRAPPRSSSAILYKPPDQSPVAINDVSVIKPSSGLEPKEAKAPDAAHPTFCMEYWFSFGRLWALMVKNFIKMQRNPTMFLFIFCLPAVQVVFFCVAIGRDPTNLRLGFVDHEIHDTDASFGPDFNLTHFFAKDCPVNNSCVFSELSCRYLWELGKSPNVILERFEHEELAINQALDAHIWGTLSFHANYSNALLDRLLNALTASEETRNASQIEVRLDMSNQQVAFVLQRTLMEAYARFMVQLLVDCNLDKSLANLPLHFGQPIYGTDVPNFTDFMAPGVIIMINFFLAVALTGEAFISEKRDGLLDRSRVAGVLILEILAAAVFTQFIVLIGQSAITLVFILAVFGVTSHGPLGWIIVLTLLQGTAGMCFGFLLSCLFDKETTAMQACIGSFYPIMLLSGILWPVEGMPFYFEAVSWYLPCTAACQAMRDIMSRGWSVHGRYSVQLGMLASVAWIAIFLIASLIFMKLFH